MVSQKTDKDGEKEMSLKLSEEELERACDFIRKLGEELAELEEKIFSLTEKRKYEFDLAYLNACQIEGTQRQKEAMANTAEEVVALNEEIAKVKGRHIKVKKRLDLEMAKLDIWRTISANIRKEKDWYNKGG